MGMGKGAPPCSLGLCLVGHPQHMKRQRGSADNGKVINGSGNGNFLAEALRSFVEYQVPSSSSFCSPAFQKILNSFPVPAHTLPTSLWFLSVDLGHKSTISLRARETVEGVEMTCNSFYTCCVNLDHSLPTHYLWFLREHKFMDGPMVPGNTRLSPLLEHCFLHTCSSCILTSTIFHPKKLNF